MKILALFLDSEFTIQNLPHDSQKPLIPIPQHIPGGFAVNRRGLILQQRGRIVAAADHSAYPGTRIHRRHQDFVNVGLQLQVELNLGPVSRWAG